MDLGDFYLDTQRMSDWFGKTLKDGQMDQLFAKLKHIPKEAYADIVDRIIESTKPMPSNFPYPRLILENYWKWRDEHPQKVQPYERTGCDGCGGEGVLHVHVPIEDAVYVQVVRCKECDNWKPIFGVNSPVSMFARWELEARGLFVESIESRYGVK